MSTKDTTEEQEQLLNTLQLSVKATARSGTKKTAVAIPLGLQCCVKLHTKHSTDVSWGPEQAEGLF